jgi:UDP-3-O-[3-hydroxymyristoyl] glucosamine N-acyltransferase
VNTGAGWTLGDLAQRFALELRGPPATPITGVATLANAGTGQLSFLANTAYRRELSTTRADAVVLRAEHAEAAPGAVLIASDPYVAFAGASIGPLCSVGARSRIGRRRRAGPGCVIGEDCVVGAGSVLVARVTLVTRVRLGERVLVHPGAVLGADGFGLAIDPATGSRCRSWAACVIGDDCEIGANTTIDRGALDDTVLEEDVRLDNQIQIGHNVRIGAHTAMAGCAAVAGSARIGRYCLIGGGVGIVGHLEICDRSPSPR